MLKIASWVNHTQKPYECVMDCFSLTRTVHPANIDSRRGKVLSCCLCAQEAVLRGLMETFEQKRLPLIPRWEESAGCQFKQRMQRWERLPPKIIHSAPPLQKKKKKSFQETNDSLCTVLPSPHVTKSIPAWIFPEKLNWVSAERGETGD